MSQKVRIGLIQMSCDYDAQANLDKALRRIEQTAGQGAKIICLQELFKTKYFCQAKQDKNFSLAEVIPGPSTRIFSGAAKTFGVVLIVPLFERTKTDIFYNTAVVIDADGKILGQYRKAHIPYDPGFYEKYYFKPGDLGFPVFETAFGKIGVLICWDQWFPEAARIIALKGAQIIFYPTAIGWKPNKAEQYNEYRSAWRDVQRTHAIANGLYVAAVNRVGQEGCIKFWGNSFVADPFGKVISEANDSKEECLEAVCDFSRINKIRKEWPFFRDRRSEFYEYLCRTTSRGKR